MTSKYKKFDVPKGEIFHTHETRLSVDEKRVAERFGFRRMKDVHRITIGDWYGHKVVTSGDIDASLAIQAAREMKAVVWRTVFRDHKATWFNNRGLSIYHPDRHKSYISYITKYVENIERAFTTEGDPNAIAVELIHDYGMEAWHWGVELFVCIHNKSVLMETLGAEYLGKLERGQQE